MITKVRGNCKESEANKEIIAVTEKMQIYHLKIATQ